MRILYLICSIFFLQACALDRVGLSSADSGAGGSGGSITVSVGGTGGTSGEGGSAGMTSVGGQGGQGGSSTSTGGSGGSGGQGGTGAGGQGGTGGSPPCEVGIYLTVDSQGSGGNLLNSVGPVLSTSYVVHGTSTGNELNANLRLINNLAGDFTTPQATSAFEGVRIRCQDPSGANSYTVACTEVLVNGEATCVMPACYSSGGGTVLMQLQVDPDVNGGGEMARIGIDPSVHHCLR